MMERYGKLVVSAKNKEFEQDFQLAFDSLPRAIGTDWLMSQGELMEMCQKQREQWLHGKLKHSMKFS